MNTAGPPMLRVKARCRPTGCSASKALTRSYPGRRPSGKLYREHFSDIPSPTHPPDLPRRVCRADVGFNARDLTSAHPADIMKFNLLRWTSFIYSTRPLFRAQAFPSGSTRVVRRNPEKVFRTASASCLAFRIVTETRVIFNQRERHVSLVKLGRERNALGSF